LEEEIKRSKLLKLERTCEKKRIEGRQLEGSSLTFGTP